MGRWRVIIRYAPLLCGIISSLLAAWTWAPHTFSAEISDERAYVLQSEIFAHGKWKVPPRPLPEFFEEGNVFVTPFVASKYWPGHSLALIPGVWLGWPPAVPLFLAGVAGALVFSLARALCGNSAGFVTWALWVATGPTLPIFASFFSETTALACWLIGWFALLRRYRDGDGRWVVVAMASAAWIMITRPLSGVAYAIPTGFLILYVEWQRRSLRPLLYGAGVVAIIGAIIPLWCWKTTGDVRTVPWTLYSRIYMPFDKIGFGLDSTPRLRVLPPDILKTHTLYINAHREHTIKRLPAIALERGDALTAGLWPIPRPLTWSLLAVGLFSIPALGLVAPAAAVAVFALYLGYASPAGYTVYYVEAMPVFAFLATSGLQRIFTAGERRWKSRRATQVIFVTCGILGLVASLRAAAWTRLFYDDRMQMRMRVAQIPTPRNLVFMHYPDSGYDMFEFVHNGPFLEKEKNVVVFDRGPEMNARLAALFPERKKYIMNVESWTKATITALK
jgi:hypothetical protein